MASNRGRRAALVGVDMTTSCSRRVRTPHHPPANDGYHRQKPDTECRRAVLLPMLFDRLCRYIDYGWGSVETQQIPAILEVGHPIEVATESAITLKAASQMFCPVSGVGRMVWS